MRGLGDVIHTLVVLLPTWALVLLGLGLAAVLLPGLRFRTRSRQIREAVRRMVRADPRARGALEARAFERAGESVHLIAEVAQEARKRTMPKLWDEALRRLDAHPKGAVEAARLRRDARPAKPAPLHPVEVAVRVHALLAEGATEAARARLAEGLARSPEDAELLALHRRLDPP